MDISFSEKHEKFRQEVQDFLSLALTPELLAGSAACPGMFQDYDTNMQWHKILYEKGWIADKNNKNDLVFSRTIRDVEEKFIILYEDIKSEKFKGLDNLTNFLQEIFLSTAILNSNEVETKINGPTELVNEMINIGKKGLTFQRYKGLGEMNPDQLWETTLDPQYRSLLQVNVDVAQEASEVFSDLMGDDVDKRKEFIQSNAKKVSNLDI